jgi:hypothetical protein
MSILVLMAEELESHFSLGPVVEQYIDSAIAKQLFTEKDLNSTF